MMLKAIVCLMARLGFGLTQSGCKLKRGVRIGPLLFNVLDDVLELEDVVGRVDEGVEAVVDKILLFCAPVFKLMRKQ